MNIQILYDKEDNQINQYYIKLKQIIEKQTNKKINKKTKYIIVISNDIKKSKDIIYKIKKYYKNKKTRVYIITGNLDTGNILECVNISKYIYYIKSPIEKTVKRIIKTFEIV